MKDKRMGSDVGKSMLQLLQASTVTSPAGTRVQDHHRMTMAKTTRRHMLCDSSKVQCSCSSSKQIFLAYYLCSLSMISSCVPAHVFVQQSGCWLCKAA